MPETEIRLLALAIILCWTIFWVFWLVQARSVKRTARPPGAKQRLAYNIPTFGGAVLLWIGFMLPNRRHVAPGLWPAWPPSYWLGVAIVVLGLWVAIWARVILGRNWSVSVVLKEEHELIVSGPYAWMRHPIYTGILLMLFGSIVALGTPISLAGLLLMGVGIVIKLRQEENLMIEQFPGAYPDYQRRVKRLVPFVW